MKRWFFLCISLLPVLLNAQLDFYRSNAIPVEFNSVVLDHPWAGGLNSSQWSTIDLNIDGVKDLFIYDRSSKQIHTFLKDPTTGDYNLTFDYTDAIPEVKDWVLIRDYNCDGQKDIFTYTPGGIRLYENTSESGILQFELRSSLLESLYDFGTDPYYSNIYVSSIDIPSIDDFDGDGDLDIHTFTLSGLTIEYHESFASDIGDCDSLTYELKNRCYGMLAEDAVSPSVYIGQDFIDGDFCTFNVPDPKSRSDEQEKDGVHSGSSICVFDYDGNGQKDLLLGDITAQDMALVLIDDRGSLQDSAIFLENGFPAVDTPVDMHVFHTAYFEDLDNDGVRDLLISPSNGTESEDRESSWFYKNTGTNDDVDVELVSTSFIQSDMLDNGTLSIPRIVDHNQDGLHDLILSNRGQYQQGGTFSVTFWLFENTGTAEQPQFDLITENYMGLNDLGLGDHLAPTFGDLDADGDLDMIIGDGTGEVHYFENTAAPGDALEFSSYVTFLNDAGGNLDLGGSLIPQLFDLNDDGLLDLIVGERNGNTNYLENIGSETVFEFELIEDSIGDINTDQNANLIGYSAPWLIRNETGGIEAFFGTETGDVYHVANVDPDPSSTWVITDSSSFNIFNGTRSCPVLADLNNDAKPDLLNGNKSGGIGLYMGGSVPSALEEFSRGNGVRLFPNPSSSSISIESITGKNLGELGLYSPGGRLIEKIDAQDESTILIDIQGLSQGLYFLSIQSAEKRSTISFIKE